MDRGERRTESGWLRPGAVVLVFVGGALGAGAREALGVALPAEDPFPIAILIANLLGAFLLGLLLEALLGDTRPGAARARLLLGTGLLGGFTTYSALALAVTRMVADGRPWDALLYGGGTILVGVLATWAGIAAGAAVRGRRRGGATPRGARA